VISYDRLVSNANVDVYISFDNEQVGSLMADTALREKPKGKYVIVNGAINDNNAFMINTGIMKILQPAIARGDITIAGEIWPDEWSSEAVRTRFEALIAQNEHIDVVLCGNDMLAETVIAILSENRILENTLVLGQDAELSACQRVAEHTQFATIYKPVQLLALKAAGFALMLARKEKLPTEFFISDGTYSIPYTKLSPIVVTASTLDETVIRDGFHNANEVYRNTNK
ncbi:MAG TPA: substrate-binding domain-containing protein, partial [Spirochaetales bacterium]|nr:substrate-binding domain-containing protein [Spirochaetales bacterium]